MAWARLVTRAATLFVAVTAFVLAYGGSKGAALDAGMSPGSAAWYPLCIEGVLVVAAVQTSVYAGWWLPWFVLLSFSGLSVAANVAHALDHGRGGWSTLPGLFSLLVAAVPPAALPLCVHLATGRPARPANEHSGSTTTEQATEHANEHQNEQVEEPPQLVLVSTSNEQSADAHVELGGDASEHPPVAVNEHATEQPASTRSGRRTSAASRRQGGQRVSANVVSCDDDCPARDRAGRVCAGRKVSPATRTRHRDARRG